MCVCVYRASFHSWILLGHSSECMCGAARTSGGGCRVYPFLCVCIGHHRPRQGAQTRFKSRCHTQGVRSYLIVVFLCLGGTRRQAPRHLYASQTWPTRDFLHARVGTAHQMVLWRAAALRACCIAPITPRHNRGAPGATRTNALWYVGDGPGER